MDAEKKYISQLEQDHTPQAIRARFEAGVKQDYLKDFVYGAVDGTVTTFAIISGVAGAGLSTGIIIVMGLANLLADGFSMGVGNFLSVRSEIQRRHFLRDQELEHLRKIPEGEREEIRQILSRKGFEGELLEQAVDIITADEKRWVETMLTEEHGFGPMNNSPTKSALATFTAFALVGFVPLSAFIVQWIFPAIKYDAYLVSVIMTAVTFFLVGAIKSKFVNHPWFVSGLETLALGGGAAAIAYGVGALLRGLV